MREQRACLTRRGLLTGAAGLGLAAVAGNARGDTAAPPTAPGPGSGPFTVDAHCHIFSVLDLPVDGFLLALGHGMGIPNQLDGVTGALTKGLHGWLNGIAEQRSKHPRASSEVAAEIEAQLRTSRLSALRKYFKGKPEAIAGTLELCTRPREQIASQLCVDYPQTSLFLPAMVDYEYWDQRGRTSALRPPARRLDEQIEGHAHVIDALNAGGARPKLHPYVPFNPLRLVHHRRDPKREPIDSLDCVRSAIGVGQEGLGFVGVKLYPPTGFLPFGNTRLADLRKDGIAEDLDDALEELFTLCEDEEIPILTHTSSSNGYGQNYGHRASPWAWQRVLERHPKLRINLGHFGQLEGVPKDTVALDCLAWSKRIADELMTVYAHVYADLSYSVAATTPQDPKHPEEPSAIDNYVDYLAKELWDFRYEGQSVVQTRLLFGTDWWMLHLEPGFGGYWQLFIDALQRLARRQNLDARATAQLQADFFGNNALRFLGEKALARLSAYYQRHPRFTRPDWLRAGA